MNDTIYYVGAEVSFESRFLLWKHFAYEMPRPHATIIYSRKWFPYRTAKCFPLIIEPPYWLEVLEESLVLRFENQRLSERYNELRNFGATADHEYFKSHITISPPISPNKWDITKLHTPRFPITLSNEYYGTWKETSKGTLR
jgi:hypothetical protein